MSNEVSYLATTFALSNAVNESMNDDSVRGSAMGLLMVQNEVDEETFTKFLFEYSANLVAVTAELVTKVFMSQNEIDSMISEATAFGKDITE